MKNTKMKYKIVLLMILFVMSLNIVSAVYVNGTIEYTGVIDSEYIITPTGALSDITIDVEYMEFHYDNTVDSGYPITLLYEEVRFKYYGVYDDIPYNVGAPFQLFDGATVTGNGMVYIRKQSDLGGNEAFCDVKYYFDSDSVYEDDTIYDMHVYTQIVDNYFQLMSRYSETADHTLEYSTLHVGISTGVYLPGKVYSHASIGADVDVTYERASNFKNDYSVCVDDYITTTTIFRNFPEYVTESKYIIRNEDTSLFLESTYSTSNETFYDVTNNTQKYYIKDQATETEYLIYSYTPEDEEIIPTLTTDKSTYNLSETIEISYTDIDEIYNLHSGEHLYQKGYTLYILTPIIDDYKDYEAKFMQHLYSDLRDEIFTINTSFLYPENNYILGIVGSNGYYRYDEDLLIKSDEFTVYDENEYLTTSCNPEGNCYTYNAANFNIFYKITNNSNIYIKDNNGNTIQTYYNIIDEGEINYHIPDDLNKLNSYPDWKIYLNNTEYSTNYSTDVTVYWTLFVTPTPTPIYTVDIPDENVSEQIDQLKEESKPIFDLIYGLTTLVVDNPDYDNDNIVDEHEINNWFNSLIPLGILLLLIILYMGLKKRD